MATPWWVQEYSYQDASEPGSGGNIVQGYRDIRTGRPVYQQDGQYYTSLPRAASGNPWDSDSYVPGTPGERVADTALKTAVFTPNVRAPYGNLGGEAGTVDGALAYLFPMARGATVAGDIGTYGGAQRATWRSPSGAQGQVVRGPDGAFWIAAPKDAVFSEADTAQHEGSGLQQLLNNPITQLAMQAYGGYNMLGNLAGLVSPSVGTLGAADAAALGNITTGALPDVGGGMASLAEQSAINEAIASAGGLDGIAAPAVAPEAGPLQSLETMPAEPVPRGGVGGLEAVDAPAEPVPASTEVPRPNVFEDPAQAAGANATAPDPSMLQRLVDARVPWDVASRLSPSMLARFAATLAGGTGAGPGGRTLGTPGIGNLYGGAGNVNATALDALKTAGVLTDPNKQYPSPMKPWLQPSVISTGAPASNFQSGGIDPALMQQLRSRGYAVGGHVDGVEPDLARELYSRGYEVAGPVDHVPGPEGRLYARHAKRGFAVNGPGTGQSDDIPTMLADGEYVIDADTVAALGDGSTKAGAQVLDKFREQIRHHKRSAPADTIPPKAKNPLEYLRAATRSKNHG